MFTDYFTSLVVHLFTCYFTDFITGDIDYFNFMVFTVYRAVATGFYRF